MHQYDLRTPEGVKSFMSEATSDADWDKRIEAVLMANGGSYPSFWFATIMITGLAAKTAAKWGGNADIQIDNL